MTGLEAIWIPLAVGAVTGGASAAIKGGSFGDIAKGAGIGAAGGAATGGLASGLGALGGAAGGTAANAAVGPSLGVDTNMPLAPAPSTAITPSPNLGVDTNLMSALGAPAPTPIATGPNLGVNTNLMTSLQQPQPTQGSESSWTTSDYINAASTGAKFAGDLAQRPERPAPQLAAMPAIFSGQGDDLMQQLAQLGQL